MFGIAGRERLIARHFLLQVVRDPLPDRIEHDAHGTSPSGPFWPPFPFFISWSKAVAIWFMRRQINSRLVHHDGCCAAQDAARFVEDSCIFKFPETMK